MRCNLNCTYCEDYGSRRNPQNAFHEPSQKVLQIFSVIRQATDSLTITGGEPLLNPEIAQILTEARRSLKFRQLTLLTNGLLLRERAAVLPNLDRLLISLDTLDTQLASSLTGLPQAQSQQILDNIIWAASRQKIDRFTLILNAVLNPQTLAGAEELVDFCAQKGVMVSFSPQSVRNWPDYELLVSPEYKKVLSRLIALKKHGSPIAGSLPYFQALVDFNPYTCHPTLLPRVLPDGSLIYPCRPIEREGGARGGRPVNLLEVQSWNEAVQIATRTYGPPAETCASCFQQCYAEPSLLQDHPVHYLWDWLRFPASRHADLITFSPG